MLVRVNVIYLDVQANRLRRPGEVFEVTADRCAAICDSIPGAVSEVEGGQAAAPEQPAPAAADAPSPAIDEMTCAQLRDLIESKGGEAPAKAKRAELAEIAAAL